MAGKVTVISCAPNPIHEEMPHMHPSNYDIPAAAVGDIEVLFINDGIDRVYARDGRHIERVVPAEEIAQNLIKMYVTSQLSIGDDAYPGVFYVDGHYPKEIAKIKFKDRIEEARRVQSNWFSRLVEEGNDVWTRFHQFRAITKLMRDAAKYLEVEVEWAPDYSVKSKCPACAADLPSSDVLICQTCRTIIKPEEYKKKFQMAV